ESKFNDANGTPVISGATVRWRIFDPELVVYDLEDDIENFLVAQIEGNLRSVVSKYPYEASNDDQQGSDVDAKSRGI
ncbi:SPFH domain-containing protein, partial [Vibrio cholerae]